MQGLHFYIISAMTSFTITCWKQSFLQLNTRIKFLEDFASFSNKSEYKQSQVIHFYITLAMISYTPT